MPSPKAAALSPDKPFRIWRSEGAVLIRFSTGEQIELSLADAASLAASLAIQPMPMKSRRYWTDERKEELRRAYEDDGLSLREIAQHFGFKTNQTANSALRALGIPARNSQVAEASRDRMLKHHANKRSRRAA